MVQSQNIQPFYVYPQNLILEYAALYPKDILDESEIDKALLLRRPQLKRMLLNIVYMCTDIPD